MNAGSNRLSERAMGRLRFTTDVEHSVHHGTVQFIAVVLLGRGRLSRSRYVVDAALLGQHLRDYKWWWISYGGWAPPTGSRGHP
jgi:hypothetical protein